jgi:hypothetical protein
LAKKKKPIKKKPVKSTPRKRAKRAPAKKQKRRGVIGSAIGKIPEKVRIKGGKSKSAYKSKHGSLKMESEYKELEVGK